MSLLLRFTEVGRWEQQEDGTVSVLVKTTPLDITVKGETHTFDQAQMTREQIRNLLNTDETEGGRLLDMRERAMFRAADQAFPAALLI